MRKYKHIENKDKTDTINFKYDFSSIKLHHQSSRIKKLTSTKKRVRLGIGEIEICKLQETSNEFFI
jgi:hypothetical protein